MEHLQGNLNKQKSQPSTILWSFRHSNDNKGVRYTKRVLGDISIIWGLTMSCKKRKSHEDFTFVLSFAKSASIQESAVTGVNATLDVQYFIVLPVHKVNSRSETAA